MSPEKEKELRQESRRRQLKKKPWERRIQRPLRETGGRMLPIRARDDAELRNFYDDVNLPEFKKALEFGDDPRFTMLHSALSAKPFTVCSFPELCRRCKLTMRDVSNLWRDYQLQVGTVLMANHLPQLMEDIAVDALSTVYSCEFCSGSGRNPETKLKGMSVAVCPVCHGDGKVRIPGDKDARNLVFESMNLKKSGVAVSQTVNVNTPSLSDTLDSLESVVDITSSTTTIVEPAASTAVEVTNAEIPALPPSDEGN